MKQTRRLLSPLLIGLAITLALVVVGQLTRVVQSLAPAPYEPGAHKIYELSTDTHLFLAELEDDLLITYYASAHAALPSRLRHLRSDVELVLRRLSEASEASTGHVHCEVVIPEDRPELREYLTELGLASFRARSVEQDGWSEAEVWSSLRISRGAAPDAILHAVTPEMVPGLQKLIVEQARAQATHEPLRPKITLAVPQDQFRGLEQLLQQSADVTRIDISANPNSLPEDTDLLFWMDVHGDSSALRRALADHLQAGRPAVLAATPHSADLLQDPAHNELLFAEYGVQVAPGVLRDKQANDDSLRCIAQHQDFRPLGAQPNGTLSFGGARLLQLDQQSLREEGRSAHFLATADGASVFRKSESNAAPASILAPRSPLLLLLSSSDPQQGALVLAASSTPFSDRALADDTSANRGLVRVLVDELAAPAKLVSNRAFVARAPQLTELPATTRSLWRGVTIFMLPGAWLLFVLVRSGRRRSGGTSSGLPTALRLAFALAITASLTYLASSLDLQLDSTANDVHSISAEEERVVARAIQDQGQARIELLFSPASELPPELRVPARRARDLCRELARRTPGVQVTSPALDQVSDDERLAPRLITSRSDESSRVRRVTAAIRIHLGSDSTVLQLTESSSYQNLRFRLAFAFWRLSEGRPIRVAIAAPASRLSAAEDQFDYREMGLFAPTEGDHFTHARELLVRNDFELITLDPNAPTSAAEPDLLLWLQPRREIGPMLRYAAASLASGGDVLLAAQHYKILPRQLRRDEMELSFWPRPQHNDLERDYFPGLGIELEREIFLDEVSAPISLPTRIERRLKQASAGHELEDQFSAQPFIVRALASGFGEHPITRGLGDLLLPSPNELLLNPSTAATFGIQGTPLVLSSSKTWHYDWQGGDLPADLLAKRDTLHGLDLPHPRKLATLYAGRFPEAVKERERLADGSERARFVPGPAHNGVSGQLLVVGCSAMFEDDSLANPDFDNSQFLLHSVINLTLGDELTSIASRRLVISGFESPSNASRFNWRLLTLGFGPVAGLLLAACLMILRRRSTRVRVATL